MNVMCGACREQDCECCDLRVWGGPCDCGCPIPGSVLDHPLRVPPELVIILNSEPRKEQKKRGPKRGNGTVSPDSPFAEQVRAARVETGASHKQLAMEFGVGKATISRILTAKEAS